MKNQSAANCRKPIELVINTDRQGVEIGAYGYRCKHKIVVPAAEIVEVILDLTRDVLDQPKLDARSNGEAATIIIDDLRADVNQIERIFSLGNVHPGAAGESQSLPADFLYPGLGLVPTNVSIPPSAAPENFWPSHNACRKAARGHVLGIGFNKKLRRTMRSLRGAADQEGM